MKEENIFKIRFNVEKNMEIVDLFDKTRYWNLGENFINFMSLDIKSIYDDVVNNIETSNYKKIISNLINDVEFFPEIMYMKAVSQSTFEIKEDEFVKSVKEDIKDILKLHQKFKKIIDFCYLGESDMTPLQNYMYYLVLSHTEKIEIPKITIDRFGVLPNEDNENKIKEKDFVNIIKENSPYLWYAYDVSNMEDYMMITLLKLLENNYKIRKCKNCGKYFIAYQREDTFYCDRVAPQDETKTCNVYGPQQEWKNKVKNDGWYSVYRKIYVKKKVRINREKKEYPNATHFEKEFDTWKTEVEQWKKLLKNNKVTEEEFIEWLKKFDEK